MQHPQCTTRLHAYLTNMALLRGSRPAKHTVGPCQQRHDKQIQTAWAALHIGQHRHSRSPTTECNQYILHGECCPIESHKLASNMAVHPSTHQAKSIHPSSFMCGDAKSMHFKHNMQLVLETAYSLIRWSCPAYPTSLQSLYYLHCVSISPSNLTCASAGQH